MKKTTVLLGLLLVALLILPNFALALGQMTEPIVISNALRGESIQQELIAVNSDKTETEVIFTAEGAVKDWSTFYLPGDLETPAEKFILPASGNLRVIVVIDVPDDIENGEYKGSFGVSNIPNSNLAEGESGSNVKQKIDRQISISISDQEEVSIDNTSVIPNKFDLNKDEPLSIRVVYDNQGNIRLSPQIRLKIKNTNDKNVLDVIYPYPEDEIEVNSKSQHEISPIIVQTIGWEAGKYFATMEFTRADEKLLEKDFAFTITENKLAPEVDNIDKNNLIKYVGLALFLGLSILIIIWQFTKKTKK